MRLAYAGSWDISPIAYRSSDPHRTHASREFADNVMVDTPGNPQPVSHAARVDGLLAHRYGILIKANNGAGAVIGTLFVLLLIGQTPAWRLIAAVALIYFGVFAHWVGIRHEASSFKEKRDVFLASNTVLGITWGLCVWLAMPNEASPQFWIAVGIPLGMVVNMVESSSIYRVFLGFHIPFSVLSMLAFAISGVGDAKMLPVIFGFISLYVLRLARLTHKESRVRAELTVRNEDLIADLHAANEQLKDESHLDRLTDLPNRRALERFLASSFADHRSSDADADNDDEIIALFIDLDGFKKVNDTYGHHIGDEILNHVGRRLAKHCPPDACLARYGGDEFVIAIPNRRHIAAGETIAEAIVADIARPFALPDATITLGTCVGVAITSPKCRDARTLLHLADMALYEAKAAGRSRWMSNC